MERSSKLEWIQDVHEQVREKERDCVRSRQTVKVMKGQREKRTVGK